MLGLSGSHRVGKSTLAKAFAERFNVPFVETSASAVINKMGLDPKQDYPFETRMAMQEMLLGVFEMQYRKATKLSRVWIADRTPIDLASYLMADVQRSTLKDKPHISKIAAEYTRRCLKVAGEHFAVIMLVQPGIQVVEAEGKAPACPAYMEHLNTVQLGLLADEHNPVRRFMMPRAITDLDERLQWLTKTFSSCIQAEKALNEARVMH